VPIALTRHDTPRQNHCESRHPSFPLRAGKSQTPLATTRPTFGKSQNAHSAPASPATSHTTPARSGADPAGSGSYGPATDKPRARWGGKLGRRRSTATRIRRPRPCATMTALSSPRRRYRRRRRCRRSCRRRGPVRSWSAALEPGKVLWWVGGAGFFNGMFRDLREKKLIEEAENGGDDSSLTTIFCVDFEQKKTIVFP
jgi:hypothetical protein